MKTFIRSAGLFILALSLGILLAPRAGGIAQLTGSALLDQIQLISGQIQSSLDAATPGVAIHIATLLLALGAVIVASFIYLLVFVPIRIHSMHREIRRQREQIQSMKSEVHLSSELLLDARRDYDMQGMSHAQHEVARPRLQRWTGPRRDGHQTKDATHT